MNASTNSIPTSQASSNIGANFRPAVRVHKALTADAERRVLRYFAERMPRAVNSDHLTLLGFVAEFLAGASFALARWNKYALLAASFFIVVNWFGDSLDGTLARVRNQQRPRYGFYVDHVVDAFGACFLLCGLALSGYLHWEIAMAMLVSFLLISIESYLATYTLGAFHMSHGSFGPTELRILLIAGCFALLHSPYATVFGHRYLLFDIGGAIGSVGMLIMTIVAALRHTADLYIQEPVR